MSLSEMTITPVAAPTPGKPAGSAPSHRAPAQPVGTIVHSNGRFSSADGTGPEPIVRREGGTGGVAPPVNANEILKKFGATWAQESGTPAPSGEAKPADATPAKDDTPAPTAAIPQEGQNGQNKPADATPAPAPLADDFRAAFGERKPSEVKEEFDRYVAANRQLATDLETARKQPAPVADDGPHYIDDSLGWLRRGIAKALGHTNLEHPEVEAEMSAFTLDLNANRFGATLDDAQQAKRDAAKARQALARDTRARTAQGDSSASHEEAAAKRHVEFIGNRLSATSTGSDGKTLPSMREQFPLAAAMARRSGIPLEAHVLHEYLRTRDTGRYDPKRGGDDDYLIHETLRHLESQAQDLLDDLGKARPQPSTAPQPTQPANAPASATSASQGQPQSHGGRTALTAADSSAAPPTPPSAPVPQAKRKLQTREEFFAKHYPKQ